MTAKQALASAVAALYIAGIVVVHSHLLRYGVNEISPLQIRYVLVGSLLAASLLPAAVFIAIGEFWVSHLRTSMASLLSGAAVLALVVIGILQWRFGLDGLILNVAAYPYPLSFPRWNIITTNAELCVLWVTAIVAKRYVTIRVSRFVLVAAALAIVQYLVIFGRTIWPALDQGIGGGAPEFVVIHFTDAPAERPALLVHRDGNGYYYLPLEQLPEDLASRGRGHQFTTDKDGPVRRALEANRVEYALSSHVERMVFVQRNLARELVKYIDNP